MKGWLKVVLVVCLLALVGMVAGGCVEAGPEAAVRGMYRAMEAKDADKVGEYVTEDIRDLTKNSMNMFFNFVDSIKIRNLKLTVVSETEDTATVKAEYDLELELKVGDGTVEEKQTDTLNLVKVDGKWLLTVLPEL